LVILSPLYLLWPRAEFLLTLQAVWWWGWSRRISCQQLALARGGSSGASTPCTRVARRQPHEFHC
jgi:hypothetical protein